MDLATRKSSPGRSTTRRNLFSTIINFSVSQGVKVNGNSSPSSAGNAEEGQTTEIPHNNCSSIEVQEVSTRNAKPRDELSVSASNLAEISGGMSLGHAPKTFSVLTALNQSDETYRDQHRQPERRNLRTCVSTGTLSSPAASANPNFTLPTQSSMVNIHGQRMQRNADDNASVSGGSSNGYHQIIPRSHTLASLTPRRNLKSLSAEQITTINSNKNRIRACKSKERTPDWIWKIFQLAKRGRLEELKSSLVGLDPTLIRHLADAKGNTLLHCAARGGHLLTLQWLVSILGNQIEAALNDQNRAGRTVVLSTLKGGQLECFQWIVLHTSSGDKGLVPTEGKWSLLHFASKYGNEGVVRWLCEQLVERHVRVDLRDAGGLTPLHVAAKAGRIAVSQELIRAGADPLAQTELGLRPCDLAFRHRHLECANYFIMAEAAGSLGKDLESIHMDFTTLHSHQETLRTHFREVLRVAKLLIKERGDLIKRFGGGNEGSSGSSAGSGGLLLSGPSTNGARLAELEHTLVLGEQGWKKLESNRVDMSPKFLFSGGSDLLQTRLSESHGRFEKNIIGAGGVGVMMSGSSCSSDNEGSGSSVTSGDEERTSGDPRLKSCLRTRPRNGTGAGAGVGLVSSSPLRSSNTPWLLESDDSILSALSSPSSRNTSNNSINIPNTSIASQHLPNLDLLSGASATATNSPLLLSRAVGPPGRNSSSSENSPGILRSKIYTTAEIVQSSTPVSSSAAVLEVIEPTTHSAKKPSRGQGSPINKSILRNALLSQTSGSPTSISSTIGTGTTVVMDPSSTMTFMNCSVENEQNFALTKPTKRYVKPRPCESQSQLSPSHKKEFEEIYLAPDLIRGTQHRNNGGTRTVVPVIGRVIPIVPEGRAVVQSRSSNSLADEIYSDFEGTHFPSTFHSTRNSDSTDGSLAVGPKGGNFRAPHISSTTSTEKCLLSFSTPQPITAPSQANALEFFLENQNPKEQVTNSPYVSVVLGTPSSRTNYGGSLTILPLEQSNPNSSSKLIPDKSSTEDATMTNDPTDRISPSPSETSKTESAVAPPFSHCHSEVSESHGQEDEEGLGRGKDLTAEEEKDKPVGIELLDVLKMRRGKDDKEDDDKNCLGSTTMTTTTTTPCIILHTPTRETSPMQQQQHKTPIHHRVKKSGRGRTAAKAWYEIDEGSDDDQESLLRVAAARARSRSTCHSTSSSLSGGEESGCSDGEMISFCDDGNGHECESGSCTRHNCSDFV